MSSDPVGTCPPCCPYAIDVDDVGSPPAEFHQFMDAATPATVSLAVTPRILSDVLERWLAALEPEWEVVVGRERWFGNPHFDLAIVTGSADGVPAGLVLCLPGPSDGAVGTVNSGTTRERVLLDTPLAIVAVLRAGLGLHGA
jgi:hypothetical protein